jgi:hypothetical protein
MACWVHHMLATSAAVAAVSRAHSLLLTLALLLQAALTQLDGQKLGRQGFATEAEAAEAARRVAAAHLAVLSLSSKVRPHIPAQRQLRIRLNVQP